MGKYYCLIAGLHELQLDDQKLRLSISEFKTELKENLSEADYALARLFFMQFDNQNLLATLQNPEPDLHFLGNLDLETIKEIIIQFKESEQPNDNSIYPYFRKFIPAYLEEKVAIEGLSYEDQLTSLYFDYACGCKNPFVASWYEFNLNIKNILTAISCQKYNINKETAVVGSNEIAEAIRTSNSKDFGLTPIFPEVEEIMRIAEETDIYERERKIDLMKWKWLEDEGFFHFFDVEHLFVYLLKLEMLERWVRLEKETGEKIFREMIGQMQRSFEFPNEFTIRRR